ncbi:hypothetical protein ElyMa_002574800 [Elysia marginata]|uniref:Uncharacterized protein n=1 Tax=Elysia marginata TaxID=1093978 RepID=A0AAV4H1Q3_9GAST|nr:hypothetical protein ElyMa_002574800 [Elysia marginata]
MLQCCVLKTVAALPFSSCSIYVSVQTLACRSVFYTFVSAAELYTKNCSSVQLRTAMVQRPSQTIEHDQASRRDARPCLNLFSYTPTRAVLAATVIITIILLIVVAPRVRDYERFLSGFWTGHPLFLKEAGLSQMYLYISPRERLDGRWCRQGYLLMVDSSGALISNQGVELEWSSMVDRWGSAFKSCFVANAETYGVKNAKFTYDEQAVMPENIHLGLDISQGSISLYTDETLYAFLVKDNEVSAAANAEYFASRGERP